jgi:hypothetical protein
MLPVEESCAKAKDETKRRAAKTPAQRGKRAKPERTQPGLLDILLAYPSLPHAELFRLVILQDWHTGICPVNLWTRVFVLYSRSS